MLRIYCCSSACCCCCCGSEDVDGRGIICARIWVACAWACCMAIMYVITICIISSLLGTLPTVLLKKSAYPAQHAGSVASNADVGVNGFASVVLVSLLLTLGLRRRTVLLLQRLLGRRLERLRVGI